VGERGEGGEGGVRGEGTLSSLASSLVFFGSLWFALVMFAFVWFSLVPFGFVWFSLVSFGFDGLPPLLPFWRRVSAFCVAQTAVPFRRR
jgi:hypothetical protein